MKKFVSLLLAVLCMIGLLTVPAYAASYPSVSAKAYMETKAETKIDVYKNKWRTTRGTCSPLKSYYAYIDPDDTVKILAIYTDADSALVEYPTSSGKRKGYIKLDTLFYHSPEEDFSSKATATTYVRPYGTKYGSIAIGDRIYHVGESNSHVLVIYTAKSGSRAYKLAYIKKADYKKIKYGNTNTAKYATYTGLDYTQITSDKNRIAALDKAKAMSTVIWTAPCNFVTWCSSNGNYNKVTATDNTKSSKFIAGKTYIGVPYSMINHSYDDIKWLDSLSNMTSNTMSSSSYYTHQKEGTAWGIDCSYFVYTCFKNTSLANELPYQTTKAMLQSDYYIELRSFSDLKPADLLLKNGHVMLFIGKTSNGKYAVFEATAEGSKCRYHEYTTKQIKNYKPYRFVNF